MTRHFSAPLSAVLIFCATSALAPAASAAAAETVHVVAEGHTLGKIAKRYRTTVEALRELNELEPGERLHPGQRLTIPESGWKSSKVRGDDRSASSAQKGAGPAASGKASEERPGKGSKHKPKEERDPYFKKPKKRGWLKLVRGGERFEGQVLTRRDHLVMKSLPGITKLLRYPTGARHPIDPRLVTLLGMVSNRFGGRPLEVVSGFRPYSSRQFTPHSNHNVGKAVDFRIAGVPNEVLREFCRTFRAAGVGYYPNSSFVHLDVRTERTYWVDYSKPGERPRYNSQQEELYADETTGDVEVDRDAGTGAFLVPKGDPYGSDDTPTPPSK